MCVCEWGACVVRQSRLMSDWWQLCDWCNGGWECVSAVNDGRCSPWVMCSCSVVQEMWWVATRFMTDVLFQQLFCSIHKIPSRGCKWLWMIWWDQGGQHCTAGFTESTQYFPLVQFNLIYSYFNRSCCFYKRNDAIMLFKYQFMNCANIFKYLAKEKFK